MATTRNEVIENTAESDESRGSFNDAKIISMHVVLFTDLEHSELTEGFQSVTYGDAEYTLVTAATLIKELEERAEDEEPELQPLIEELRAVPKGLLVALQG